MAAQDQDPTDLHGLAVDAQTDVQKLATGLAHAGAAPEAVATLTKMATVLSQVIKVLGQGPGLEAGGPPQGQAPPGEPQAPPPGPPQAQPQGQAPPGAAPAVQQHSILSATHALHAAMQASAAQRPQPAR